MYLELWNLLIWPSRGMIQRTLGRRQQHMFFSGKTERNSFLNIESTAETRSNRVMYVWYSQPVSLSPPVNKNHPEQVTVNWGFVVSSEELHRRRGLQFYSVQVLTAETKPYVVPTQLHGCSWSQQTLASVNVDAAHAWRSRRGRTSTSHPRCCSTLLPPATSASNPCDTRTFPHTGCSARQAHRLRSFRSCLVSLIYSSNFKNTLHDLSLSVKSLN